MKYKSTLRTVTFVFGIIEIVTMAILALVFLFLFGATAIFSNQAELDPDTPKFAPAVAAVILFFVLAFLVACLVFTVITIIKIKKDQPIPLWLGIVNILSSASLVFSICSLIEACNNRDNCSCGCNNEHSDGCNNEHSDGCNNEHSDTIGEEVL